MGSKERFAAAVAAAVSSALVAAAQAQESSSAPTQVLPQVVVSPTTVATPEEDVASSVSVVTAGDIARNQWRTVPDALSALPGLNVVQSGGPGGQTAVFIRGTNANHVKVLIDGIDVGDPSTPNGAFDFGHLLAGDIARIEVLRGLQSGLYGSDAIGGVIAITTKRGQGPFKAHGSLEAGSFGTFNQNAGFGGSEGRFNYAFNLQHFQSTTTPVTPLDLLAPGEKRIDDSYNNWTYSARLGAALSDEVSVDAVARYTDARLGFTGEDFLDFTPPAPERFQSTQLNHQLYTRGEVAWHPPGGRFKSTIGVGYSNQWLWSYDPNPDNFFTSPVVAPPTTNVGARTKIDWRGEVKLTPGETLVLGLEHQRDTLRTDSTGTVDPAFNFTQTTTEAANENRAAYAEILSRIGDHVTVAANIRFDDNESYGPHTTWRIAPVFIAPVTNTKIKATYGTGFKAPTLTQLFVDNPSFMILGNPNLQPETSRGYDFGIEQPLFDGRFRFGATYFHNDVTNLIVNVFDPDRSAFTNVNVGEAEMQGVESFASFAVNPQLTLRADYTATYTRDETTGLGLLRRPGNKASVTASWSPSDRLTLSGTLLYVGSWVDVSRDGSIPRVDAPAYTTVNFAANYKVDEHVSVFGRIDNLFNAQYENPVGFDRPGFGIFGGVRVSN